VLVVEVAGALIAIHPTATRVKLEQAVTPLCDRPLYQLVFRTPSCSCIVETRMKMMARIRCVVMHVTTSASKRCTYDCFAVKTQHIILGLIKYNLDKDLQPRLGTC
jgi:hypothetical protein